MPTQALAGGSGNSLALRGINGSARSLEAGRGQSGGEYRGPSRSGAVGLEAQD